MQNLSTSVLVKSFSLQRSQLQPGHRKSLMSSNRSAMAHLGHGSTPSSDPQGGALRQLRLDKGIDPSLLATQACISLAQLYEIETGQGELFYSDILREQTARRIARLLNTEWNGLTARHHAPPSGTNVVHLPRPGASSFVQRHEMSLDALTGVHLSQALPIQPVALGLATPSAELQTELPETVTTATNSRTSSKKFGWQVFLPLSTVAICAAMGWALTHPDAWAMAKTMLNTTHAWMASIIWGV
ncbi:hypothetical protein B9Z47_01945 [Limnohabitans sp. 2KL-1]|jgi:transcriptional regulator with XRE-family HTH domain|nr:hypothetical protein B9Z47_01945 [Limnohabitans sp. 2KL-1]